MSILKISVDNATLPRVRNAGDGGGLLAGALALETWIPQTADWDRRTKAASYPEEDLLLERVDWRGRPSPGRRPVDAPHKKGRVVLIGIACQSRAQSHGTYKFLPSIRCFIRRCSERDAANEREFRPHD